jgi:Zn2+/Cd2+-exporting ATPase
MAAINKLLLEEAHEDANEDEEVIEKKEIVRLIISALCFFTTVIFPVPFSLKLLLLFCSYLLSGYKVIYKSIKNIFQGEIFDENFLMTIATIGAIAIKQYPEAVAVMLFYEVGELFQDISVSGSKKSIKNLLKIKPEFANLKKGIEILSVDPQEVEIGDIIIIKPGEKVPLDGEVLTGFSTVDTSTLTGEAIPREIGPGEEILSGFVNNNGVLTVKVAKTYVNSTVSKILEMVLNASSKKSNTEKFITKFAKIYTPIVIAAAALLAILPPLLLNEAFSKWIYRALVFLVVSCPCALVISVPLSFFAGVGFASRCGILIKGSNFLDALSDTYAIVFDKTGTLTKGKFSVTSINPALNVTDKELLKFSAFAEAYSSHPIALAILKAYKDEVDKTLLECYENLSGFGIKTEFEGKLLLCGNKKLMDKFNIKYTAPNNLGTVVYTAYDGKFLGTIIINDEIKEDTQKALTKLKSLGISSNIMLTGDIKSSAEMVAGSLEIDDAFYELLPLDKVEKIEEIKQNKKGTGIVVFVGDGINDAPVLARADVGIAMGALGSDAAIEAADIVLMNDEISKIATCNEIARSTRKIVLENIILALGIKAIVLVLGAIGLATMWEAVFADVGVALIAVLNSLRAGKIL